MRKKSTLGLMLLLSALLTFMAACGTNSTTSSTSTPHAPQATVPTGENIYVLDGYTALGSTGVGQHIVAFHPGGANPTALVSLPAGLTSLDHQRLYTATAQNGRTTISVTNTQNGKTIRSFVIPGTYSTAGQGYDASVLSLSGQWLALREASQTVDTTTIALVDTQAGKLVKTIHLNGNFTLDAISPGGKGIYLLEKLNDAAVLSPDQKTMYFAGMHGIWAVNTSDLSVQGHFLAQQALTGVALSTNGQTLYAVDPTSGITLLNAATGQAQQVIQQPARTPWGIEWITN